MILPAQVLLAVGEYYIRRSGENYKTTLEAVKKIPGVNASISRNIPPFEKDKLLKNVFEACGDEIGCTASAGYFFFYNGMEREEMDEYSWPNFVSHSRKLVKNESNVDDSTY